MAMGGNGSDEIVNFKCCICAKKCIIREAETFCVECQDYYCTTCTDLHRMFPSAIGIHQLLDKSNFSTASATMMLPSCPSERCAIHSSKLVDMYCGDHDETLCATCIALNHRTCHNIHSISDEISTLYKKSVAEETKGQLNGKKACMEDIKKTKEQLIIKLNKHRENAAESIKQFRKEIDAILDTIERESLRKLDEKYSEINIMLEKEIKEAKTRIDELCLSLDKLNTSFGNKAQEFVSVKMSKKLISKTADSEKLLNKTVNTEIVFAPNSEIKDFLKKLEVFGSTSSTLKHEHKTTLYKIKGKKQININHVNDNNLCSIYGSCLTKDGLLLLADFSNRKLKCVNLSTETVDDSLELNAPPLDVCQTGKDEVAVTLNNRTIQFVSFGNKMVATKQLNVGHNCWGLAYRDGKLYITDNSTTLYIHDINGTLLHNIKTDKIGNPIFSSTVHVSLSSDGEKIYVADYNKGLIVLDIQGNYISTLTDKDLLQLWGVCTDGRGNIFLSKWGQSNIVQVNERTNTKLGVIEKACTGNSTSVCFYLKQNKLIVTFWRNNTINVYDLE